MHLYFLHYIVFYDYDAWGNFIIKYLQDDETYANIENDYDGTDTSITNSFIAFINPFRYRSYYYDVETGLYYLNSRYYDPQIGRFINADDISILSEGKEFFNGLNLYAYCGNNPINNTDESGNAWWHWLIAALVVIAAAVAVVVTAGGATAGILAVASVLAGGSATTIGATIAAGVFIGSTVSLLGFSIFAGIETIKTGNINSFWDIGESAMWSTITGGILGALGGFLQYKEQHPKINHSWTTERSQYWTKVHGSPNAKIGSDGYPMQLHHPYGRSGAGFYSYYPLTRTEHIALHKIIGYSNFALPYPYINYIDLILRGLGLR